MAEQHTILNVNDEEPIRYALTRMLRKGGFQVVEAATGAAVLAHLAQAPALVLLDVQLPDVSGFEVCRRLKSDPATASIPVIHLSAHFVASGDRVQGLETGADGYLIYPVEPEELIATVKALLRIRHAEAEARSLARQWQATFDGIRDAVVVVDPAGKVLRGNQALATLFGRPLGEIVGRSYAELLRGRTGGPVGPGFLEFVGLENRRVREERLGDAWFRIATDPIRDEAGAATGYVQILADLAAERRAAQAEEALEVKAAEVEQLQNEVARLERLARQFSHTPEPPAGGTTAS